MLYKIEQFPSIHHFENLGIELKVTPLKVLKSGLLNVKERVPIKMIDYFGNIINQDSNLNFTFTLEAKLELEAKSELEATAKRKSYN